VLNVANKPFMLSAIMLNVVAPLNELAKNKPLAFYTDKEKKVLFIICTRATYDPTRGTSLTFAPSARSVSLTGPVLIKKFTAVIYKCTQ
jgi:hypothetical protein